MKRTLLAAMCAVLLGLTVAGSPYAAEQTNGEILVAMASSRSICGGNTGRPCPSNATAVPPVPLAVSPPSPPSLVTIPAVVSPRPIPVPTPIPSSIATPAPTSHPMMTALLLGQTGEDFVGTATQTPDGVKDMHIKLTSVSGTITGARLTGSGTDGVWQTPFNGYNWIVAIRPQSDPSLVDVYFDYYKPITTYNVTVTFSDGAMQMLQTTPSVTTPIASATLSWDSTPNAASYRVYWGTIGRTYSSSINAGNVTTFTVDNLPVGITYYFAVTTIDINGQESSYSNEASKSF